MKKITKKQLKKLEKREINKKFKEWAISVKKRDNNECVICGKKERLNAHHLVSRTSKSTRFNLDCGITLCIKHHKWGLYSAHGNSFTIWIWMIKNRIDQYNRLLTELKRDKQYNYLNI